VNDHNSYHHQGGCHGHDSDDGNAHVITYLICSSRCGKDHAEDDNQDSTPEKFLRHVFLLEAIRNPRS
jgi:hypothetical protein